MSPRIAVVGCGPHCTNNIMPALAYAPCELDAVCDLQPDLAARNARIYGARASYTEAARMLDERRPDGVIVVGPPQMHHDIGLQVLERAIPLYVEKPTAPSFAAAQEMVACAREHRTWVMTGFMKRFGMAYRHLHGLIACGRLVPAMATLRYGHWRSEDLDGMLHFMSVHIIDLALHLLGEPASVTAFTQRRADRGISVALTLRFASGAIAQIMLDSAMPRIQERVEVSGVIEGGNALVVVDNVQSLEVHRQGHHGIDLLAPSMAEIAPHFHLEDIQIWRPDYGIPNMGQTRLFFQGFAGAVRAFVDAVAAGRAPPASNEASLGAMRVIAAVLARPDGTTELGPASDLLLANPAVITAS